MIVFLDLYGVLLDHDKMHRGYHESLSELLGARFGGHVEDWRRAHDEAYERYVRRTGQADWEGRGYGEIVDELDARNLLEMFEKLGLITDPHDALALSRALEREALVRVNARYPDARTAIERLRKAGHRVYVATGGSETNDAALVGAGIRDLIDGLFTGHTHDAAKGTPRYWTGILQTLGALPKDCVLIDDRLDYLEAAASAGIAALLLDRTGVHRPESLPPYARAVFRNLAGLPHFVETLGTTH